VPDHLALLREGASTPPAPKQNKLPGLSVEHPRRTPPHFQLFFWDIALQVGALQKGPVLRLVGCFIVKKALSKFFAGHPTVSLEMIGPVILLKNQLHKNTHL
jgi:hypothetical protein